MASRLARPVEQGLGHSASSTWCRVGESMAFYVVDLDMLDVTPGKRRMNGRWYWTWAWVLSPQLVIK